MIFRAATAKICMCLEPFSCSKVKRDNILAHILSVFGHISMTKHTNDPPSSLDARDAKARSQRLGTQLERLYKDVAEEPIPDEFLKLLEDADEKDLSQNDKD